jgi:hypothetical protein
MSTPLSGSFTWAKPSVYNSGDTFMAADYDILVKDVALLYAKPYGIVSATTSLSLASTSILFGTASNPTFKVNNPVSGAGTVGFSSQALSAPIEGLYRVTVNLQLNPQLSTHAYVLAIGQGGATANNFTYTSTSIPGDNSVIGGAFLSFITPMSASGTTGYATSVYFKLITSATTVTVNGGTLPAYNTWASLEYLGSLGNI